MRRFLAPVPALRRPRPLRALLLLVLVAAAAAAPAQWADTIRLAATPGTEGAPVARVLGPQAGAGLGGFPDRALAWGDVDGDGIDDLVIGAAGATRDGATVTGGAFVLYGGPGFAGAAVADLATSPFGTISPAGETRILGEAAGDRLGAAVAAGDVNGDGFDDIILGAPGASPGSPARAGAGAVVVVYGSAALRAATIDLQQAGEVPSAAGETLILGDDTGDRLGEAVAARDLDGDGFADLVLAARGGDPGGRADAGEAVIIWGSAAKPGATAGTGSVVNLDTTGAGVDSISAAGETRILGDDPGDGLGDAIAFGDLDEDGFADVTLGARAADPGAGTPENPTRANAGEVIVLPGFATGPGGALARATVLDLAASLLGTDTPTAAGELRILGPRPGFFLGAALTFGDVDGDGHADLLLGAPSATAGVAGDSRSNGGVAILLYGAAGRPGVVSGPGRVLDLRSTQQGVPSLFGETLIWGADPDDLAGSGVGLADVDGDGFDDVVVGVPGGDPAAGFGAGEVAIVRGGTTRPGVASGSGRVLDLFGGAGEVDVLVEGPSATARLGQGVAAAADADRDGRADLALAAPLAAHPASGAATAGFVATLLGVERADAIRTTGWIAAGDGAGGRRVPPVDFPPAIALVLDYPDDDSGAAGGGGASRVTVTRRRAPADYANISPLSDVALSSWVIEVDRVSGGGPAVRVTYTDEDIAAIPSLDEATLELFFARAPFGPWQPLGAVVAPARNTAEATLPSGSGYLLLARDSVSTGFSIPSSGLSLR